MPISKPRWTEAERQYVRDHDADPIRDVAAALGRTYDAVRIMRRRLDLGRTVEERARHVGELAPPVGTVRTWRNRQRYIKVAPRRWERLARWRWIREHGQIPPGHIIVRINRQRSDDAIENLACIPRRLMPRRLTPKQEAYRRRRAAWAARRLAEDRRAIAEFYAQRREAS